MDPQRDRYLGRTPDSQNEYDDRHKKTIQLLQPLQANNILDVGCGDGNFTLDMANACGAEEIYGVDISSKAVKLAQDRGIEATAGDLSNGLDYKDNQFDVVTACEIIEHVQDTGSFLKEIQRVLHPRGYFIISTMNMASLYDRLAILLGYQPSTIAVSLEHKVGHIVEGMQAAPDHCSPFTYKSFVELLEIHGFNIQKILGRRIANYPLDSYRILKPLDSVISRSPRFSIGMIARCKI